MPPAFPIRSLGGEDACQRWPRPLWLACSGDQAGLAVIVPTKINLQTASVAFQVGRAWCVAALGRFKVSKCSGSSLLKVAFELGRPFSPYPHPGAHLPALLVPVPRDTE